MNIDPPEQAKDTKTRTSPILHNRCEKTRSKVRQVPEAVTLRT